MPSSSCISYLFFLKGKKSHLTTKLVETLAAETAIFCSALHLQTYTSSLFALALGFQYVETCCLKWNLYI